MCTEKSPFCPRYSNSYCWRRPVFSESPGPSAYQTWNIGGPCLGLACCRWPPADSWKHLASALRSCRQCCPLVSPRSTAVPFWSRAGWDLKAWLGLTRDVRDTCLSLACGLPIRPGWLPESTKISAGLCLSSSGLQVIMG